MRLRRRPVRRLHRQQRRQPLHRMRLLVRPDDAGVLQRTAVRQGTGLPQAQSPGARDRHGDRARAAHRRAPDPRPLPRQSRHRLQGGDDRDAHLGDRLLLRPLRIRRLCRRVRAHHRAGPLRRRRHGERAAQLHARRLHQRCGRGRARDRLRQGRRLRRLRSGRRPGRAGARAGADQARRRHPAEPDRIQDPPAGERLSAAAQGHAQDGAGAEALRRGARGHRTPRCMCATATS